jgi:hypothetical protein
LKNIQLAIHRSRTARRARSGENQMTKPFVAIFVALTMIAATVPAAVADDADTPGYTGRTVVRGTNSTIAGDAAATRMQQTGSYSR